MRWARYCQPQRWCCWRAGGHDISRLESQFRCATARWARGYGHLILPLGCSSLGVPARSSPQTSQSTPWDVSDLTLSASANQIGQRLTVTWPTLTPSHAPQKTPTGWRRPGCHFPQVMPPSQPSPWCTWWSTSKCDSNSSPQDSSVHSCSLFVSWWPSTPLCPASMTTSTTGQMFSLGSCSGPL